MLVQARHFPSRRVSQTPTRTPTTRFSSMLSALWATWPAWMRSCARSWRLQVCASACCRCSSRAVLASRGTECCKPRCGRHHSWPDRPTRGGCARVRAAAAAHQEQCWRAGGQSAASHAAGGITAGQTGRHEATPGGHRQTTPYFCYKTLL